MTLSTRHISLISGISLLLMAVLAGISYEQIFRPIFEISSAEAMYNAIVSSISTIKWGIVGWSGVFILDLIVTWGFYKLFKDSFPKQSAIAALLRIVYTVMLGAGIVSMMMALMAIGRNDANEVPHLYEAVKSLTLGFESFWSKGLIIFGAHLFMIGWMLRKSSIGLKILSVFLMLGGIGYSVVHTGFALFPDQKELVLTIESIFLLPMIVGELGFAIWLVVNGGKSPLTINENPLSDPA